MAVEFSIARLSFTSGIPATRNPSTRSFALKSSFLPRIRQSSRLCKSNLGFSTPPHRSFKSFVNVNNSQAEVYENKVGGKDGEKYSKDLKTLIDAYKKAIRSGDEKIVSEIETVIYILENEKNELAQKASALLEDIASQKEKYIHTQADFDNFRKRFDKDKLRLTSSTQKQVLGSLLPIVDKFEIAKQQMRPDTEKGQKINTSYQSIYKQFVEIMRSLRVSVVPTVGKPFDPLIHEAIGREESPEFKEGIVIQETRRGFLIGDQLLRPAGVIVSAGLANKKVPSPTEEPEGEPAIAGQDGNSVSNG